MHVQERPNTHGVTRTNLIKGGETEGLSVFPCVCDFFFFFLSSASIRMRSLGLRQKQRWWCGGGQGSVWSQRLSSSQNRQGHDRGGGQTGRACSPPGPWPCSHKSLFLCGTTEWESGQPCVSWGHGARSRRLGKELSLAVI